MLAGVAPAERDQVWADVEAALQTYETSAGFVGPCELHVVSGSR
jgi:hypothetical protein